MIEALTLGPGLQQLLNAEAVENQVVQDGILGDPVGVVDRVMNEEVGAAALEMDPLCAARLSGPASQHQAAPWPRRPSSGRPIAGEKIAYSRPAWAGPAECVRPNSARR